MAGTENTKRKKIRRTSFASLATSTQGSLRLILFFFSLSSIEIVAALF